MKHGCGWGGLEATHVKFSHMCLRQDSCMASGLGRGGDKGHRTWDGSRPGFCLADLVSLGVLSTGRGIGDGAAAFQCCSKQAPL